MGRLLVSILGLGVSLALAARASAAVMAAAPGPVGASATAAQAALAEGAPGLLRPVSIGQIRLAAEPLIAGPAELTPVDFHYTESGAAPARVPPELLAAGAPDPRGGPPLRLTAWQAGVDEQPPGWAAVPVVSILEPVPEPAGGALLLAACAGAIMRRRR